MSDEEALRALDEMANISNDPTGLFDRLRATNDQCTQAYTERDRVIGQIETLEAKRASTKRRSSSRPLTRRPAKAC